GGRYKGAYTVRVFMRFLLLILVGTFVYIVYSNSERADDVAPNVPQRRQAAPPFNAAPEPKTPDPWAVFDQLGEVTAVPEAPEAEIPDVEARPLSISDVRVVRVRVETHTLDSGRRAQVVCVDWKNEGDRPIRAVDADIVLFDGRGEPIDFPIRDYCIYAESDEKPGVLPGDRHRTPKHLGFVLPLTLEHVDRAE